MIKKPILCIDFDGVIHSYTTGWAGSDKVNDPPVPGAMEFLQKALALFDLKVYSSRSQSNKGIRAMREYIREHACKELPPGATVMMERWLDNPETWPVEKPSAFLTIDDRALCFTGTWPDPVILLSFKPWNKK